jgi:adenylate cyclase
MSSTERWMRIGIGIASGSLVLAELGSEGRKERTIIGSTVNLASRLCSHAAAGEVCVSDATWTAVATKYARRREELVELKGFPGEQKCHLVVSTSQQTA